MQAVSDANRQREQLIAHTRGQAESLVLNAKAKARERVVQARAGAAAFSALLAEYRAQPAQVAITRYWQRMRTIFAEAHLAAVNPGVESNIDVNMLDGVAAYPPAVAAGEGRGLRCWRPRCGRRESHTIENVAADKLLLDGRFHQPLAERDHGAASPSVAAVRQSVDLHAPARRPNPSNRAAGGGAAERRCRCRGAAGPGRITDAPGGRGSDRHRIRRRRTNSRPTRHR